MSTFSNHFFNNSLRLLALVISLGFVWQAKAQPTIVSTVPPTGGSVSTNGPVVFTFSTGMDTNSTDAQFFDSTTFDLYTTSNWWSSGDTVLTCTPTPAFPANKTITWVVGGEDTNAVSLGGAPLGSFTTSGSTSSGGSGTNKFTTFSVGKLHFFNQTNTAAPSADPDIPYDFSGSTVLASNRTASSITLTLPTSAVSNLIQVFQHPEQFAMFASNTNLSAFDATFPSGIYTFNVTGSSNQQATVNLPASLVQPNAPHISNFTAAQSVNPTQAFVLSWDAFSGGTSADYVYVTVGSAFNTANPGVAGALNGTATSVTIPANTLQANSNYDASVGFYRAVTTSNATFSTTAYLASSTFFTLITSSTVPGVTLRLTNGVWAGNAFSFDVLAPASQTITVQSSSTLVSNSWSLLLTTNTPAGGRVHITDPRSTTNRFLYYRARTGS